jgi:tRNA pseudouridine38-40 synthase
MGRWEPVRVAEALAARDRARCGPVAPPDGLYLEAVTYP